MSFFFFFYESRSSSLCTAFDAFSSTIDEVPPIISSANIFVFGDFSIHHKDWLTYSGGNDRPGEVCYNFPVSNNFIQMVSFPTGIPDCDSHSLALLDLFISFTMTFSSLGSSGHVIVSVFIEFPSKVKGDAPFYHTAYNCFSCSLTQSP